ncbi:YkgJ family cysteine cluster protein [Candidatus Woesearchaeota archaeon]|nr:YkgJ family cysteine cluster protein [Candidatus Woesearchaeota archaeon]
MNASMRAFSHATQSEQTEHKILLRSNGCKLKEGIQISITKNTPLKEVLKLAAPCRCDSCNHGCKFGSGSLAGDDARNIAKFLDVSEETLKKGFLEEIELFNKKLLRPKLIREKGKPYGRCVFFDDNKGCTIHEVKPLECRASIQCRDYGEDLSVWFMVNHAVDVNDAESIRQYAAYLKSGGKLIQGAELESLVPDKEKLGKILKREI